MVKVAHEPQKSGLSTFGIRHLQCGLIFTGFTVSFMMRVNLSVAIVAMLDRNATNPDYPEFAWSERTKSLVLSSFFWGYFITQVPAGQLAYKFGGKIMLTYGVTINGLLALCTPHLTLLGDWPLLCGLRFVQGLSQGVLYPSAHTILSRWAPPEERGVLATFCYSGSQFGSIAIMAVSGVLAASVFGWPGIFYLSGITSLLWVVIWLIWGAGSPSECVLLSEREKLYIATALASSGSEACKDDVGPTPWGSIFRSVPFWVLTVAQCGYNFGYWTMLTQIPSYMKHVLGKDIKSNALLSALPYVANMSLGVLFCVLANVISTRHWLSMHSSRKLFNTIGLGVPVVTLILLGYISANEANLAVVLITLTVGVNSASFLGFWVNHMDLSPNFAGILMGVTNGSGNVMSMFAPLIVGFVVTDADDAEQWRVVFLIAAGFYFVATLLFLTLGSTKIQPWNNPKKINDQRRHIKFERIRRSAQEA